MMKEVRRNVLFLVILTISFLAVKSYDWIPLRPQSVHQWRQSDCTSYARMYHQDDRSLFNPRAHSLTGKNGEMVSEFPVLYYVAGKLYHVFGPHEGILRALTLVTFLLGVFALYGLSRLLIHSEWLAFLPPLFLLFAPYINYYSVNFLPDLPALSLVLCGWYFLFCYFKAERERSLWLAFLCFTLASLFKISASVSLVAATLLLIQYWIQKGYLSFRILKSQKLYGYMTVAIMCVSYGVLGLWVLFAKYYNAQSGNGANLLGILPIWDMSREAVLDTFRIYGTKWYHQILWPPFYYLMGLSIVSLFIFWKKIPQLLRMSTLWLLLGQVAYMILWFDTFYHHDYYLVNTFILPVFLFLMLTYLVDRWTFNTKKRVVRYTAAAVMAILIMAAAVNCRSALQARYSGNLYESCNKDLYDIEPYLRSLGLQWQDKVFSAPDASPNITLNMMNQQGWTEAYNTHDYNIDYFLWAGADYMIISDSAILQNPLYSKYAGHEIGQHKSVKIYDLRPYKQAQ